MSKPLILSEPMVWILKYLIPMSVILAIILGYYLDDDQRFAIIYAIGSMLYWFFRILPLKEVRFENNYLLISNDFKKDKVDINDIEKIKTGSGLLYRTRIQFSRETKFGRKIVFATMKSSLGGGMSDEVKDVLHSLKKHIDENKYPIIGI